MKNTSYSKVISLNPLLTEQIQKIKFSIPVIKNVPIQKVLLIGSCSESKATYRSDIDLLIIVEGNELTFSKVREWRDQFEKVLGPTCYEPLTPQFTFVLSSVLATSEPAMKKAIEKSILLWSKKND